MTFKQILLCSGLCTVVAFSYVHQRVEIIKMGYGLHEDKKALAHLVDQNSRLMYNLSRLESPKSLLNSVDAANVNFARHRTQTNDRFLLTANDNSEFTEKENAIGRFLDLWTTKAEAKSRK